MLHLWSELGFTLPVELSSRGALMSTSSSSVVTSLDYVRMYAEVTGWVAEAVVMTSGSVYPPAATTCGKAYDEAEGEPTICTGSSLARCGAGSEARSPTPLGRFSQLLASRLSDRWAACTPVGVLEGVDYDEMCDWLICSRDGARIQSATRLMPRASSANQTG
jgi:hypothetical protein